MRRADEVAGRVGGVGEHRLRIGERRADGLLDEHVLAGGERGAREAGVLGHAREHEHDVDVVALDHGPLVGEARIGARARRRGCALRGIDVPDRRDGDAALPGEPLDERHVRAPEDAAEAEHAEPDGHAAPPVASSAGAAARAVS